METQENIARTNNYIDTKGKTPVSFVIGRYTADSAAIVLANVLSQKILQCCRNRYILFVTTTYMICFN